MKRVLESEAMDSWEEALELDRMTQKYIYVLNEAMARSAMKLGVSEGQVLEIGIGPARIATKLVTYNPKFSIIGIDLSKNMLKLAGENLKGAGIESHKVRRIRADAKILPFKTGSFDLVISHNMLHHLPDPSPMLKEVERVVKPEGGILIRDIVRPYNRLLAWLYSHLFGLNYTKNMRRLYYESMLAAFTMKEIKTLYDSTGIVGTKIRSHFLTHYGIEKKSAEGGAIDFEVQRSDPFRELSLSFYMTK